VWGESAMLVVHTAHCAQARRLLKLTFMKRTIAAFALVVGTLTLATTSIGCIVTTSNNPARGGGISYRFTGPTSQGGDCVLDSATRGERMNRIGAAGAGADGLFVATTQLGGDSYRMVTFVAADNGAGVPAPGTRTTLDERIFDYTFTQDSRFDNFSVSYAGSRVDIEVAGIPAGYGCNYAY
jgi:hypothetical protein